ncbi:MAG: hypothetical protein ACRDUA_01840 [Micromonosporaceae bacterium]
MAAAQPELSRHAYQEMFDAATPIMEFGTAYEAETAISMLLGGVYANVIDGDRRSVLTTFVDDFVKYLQRRRTPQSMAVMAGLSAVAPGVGGERARKAVQRFAERDIDAPRWVHQAGNVRPTSVLKFEDGYGDQSQYMITYEYEVPEFGGPDHAVAVVVDHNKRMVTDLAVVAPAQQLLGHFQEAVGNASGHLTVAAVEPAVARVEVERHLLRTEQLSTAPNQSFLDNWALVSARLTLQPDALEPLNPSPPLDDAARDAVVSTFLESEVARKLAEQMTSRVPTPSVVIRPATRLAVDYAVEANSGDPLRWSPVAVRDMLLNWAPQQAGMPTEVRSWLPEVVDAFSLYGGTVRGLSEDAVSGTRIAVAGSTQEYTSRMSGDPDGEPMDVVFEQMLAAGVDPTDEDASRQWLADYLDKRKQRGDAVPPSGGTDAGRGRPNPP